MTTHPFRTDAVQIPRLSTRPLGDYGTCDACRLPGGQHRTACPYIERTAP
jgi:hypothetical protein